ncbi:glycosyltransferase [Streptomyces sp. NPDC056656]|uniref:glycosyltransferase n=1 Tax=Streptomyces sp. NPDC056656 TaxID=3345895 RepID=UPI0036A9B754
MKISFLVDNAYGTGQTIRATANISRALAARHDVEVVSVHRTEVEPLLSFDARVQLSSLIDLRGPRGHAWARRGAHPLSGRPSVMFHGPEAKKDRPRYTALHDRRISGRLARTDADVVVATEPILNGYLARYGGDRCLRIGQEHLSLAGYAAEVRRSQKAVINQLDAFVTISEADADHYRSALPSGLTRIIYVPYGVTVPRAERASLDSKVIVAAGPFIPAKRYDRLIAAFAKVAPHHPAWTLRLYGRGPRQARLRSQIGELGLHKRVLLMGSVAPIETEWAKGAIAAVSSDRESSGMSILEAMHCGVPVVATDCPHGPAEIITDHENGLLVPLDGGTDGYAEALDRLMSRPALRAELGESACERARDVAPEVVALRYEDLFESLSADRRHRPIATSALPCSPGPLRSLRTRVRQRPGRV